MAYRLTKKDLSRIGEIRGAVEALTESVTEMQYQWDDATERWQESERGSAVQEWISQLEDQLREIGDLADELEDSQPDC